MKGGLDVTNFQVENKTYLLKLVFCLQIETLISSYASQDFEEQILKYQYAFCH